MSEIIIFCSAPADIKFALTIRESYPQAYCRIFAIQVEDMAVFLRSLYLPARTQVEFIPYPTKSIAVKRVWNNLTIRSYLDRIKQKHFSKTKNCHVYFFAPYMDWVLFSFLQFLQPENRLTFVSYLPPVEHRFASLSHKNRLMRFWTKWVTRTDIAYAQYCSTPVLVWEKMHEIETMEAPDYCSTLIKHAWNPTLTPASGTSLLLFPGCEALSNNIKQVTLDAIQRLEAKGFSIFLKPHPRLDCPVWLLDLGLKLIPRHVPAEFVDLHSFSGVIGYESSALALAAKHSNIPCISLIHLLNYHQASSTIFYKEYLLQYSGGKIFFADTLEQVEPFLLKGKIK